MIRIDQLLRYSAHTKVKVWWRHWVCLICTYRHTYLVDLFSERARLAPPWPLTSSQVNTASVYYLLNLSSFSLLSPFVSLLSSVLFCFVFFVFFVSLFLLFRLLFIRKASRQRLIRIFPKYMADTQPCDGPPSRLYVPFFNKNIEKREL